MNANDNDRAKRLDEYIDALNAGRPAPQVADDADLADLFATARDLHRLRAAEPAPDDVPSRLAVALERELRANPTHGTRRIGSNDMSLFRDASSNGSLRPPDDGGANYAMPHHPERRRQLVQFVFAVAAFVIVGVVLAQIIGGSNGNEPNDAVGVGQGGTPTTEVAVSDETATHAVEETPSGSLATLEPTPSATDPTVTATTSSGEPTEEAIGSVEPTATPSPDAPDATLLRLSPDYVTCDDTVIAYGANFAPETTITIYGGQMIGNNFGPVVDEYPVSDIGTFEVELDLRRLIGECGGGSDEEREGSQYRLFASTGSALVKDGINAEGPSAMAVLTFSRNVPDSVRNRTPYQYCGVEVILNGTLLGEAGEPDREARECFIDNLESGGFTAEFISHRQTTEGDMVTTIYRTGGDGEVVVVYDNTRDRFGSGNWLTHTCTGAALGDMPWYEIVLEGCGQDVVLQ